MFVIIAGAGALGQEVARALVIDKHDVVVVDKSKEACELVYTRTGAVTVHGSATDLDVLEEAGGRKADVLLPLMHRDADNMTCALLARSLGVPRVIARLRDPKYEHAYREAGVTHVVMATDLLRNQIVSHVEHPKIREIMGLQEEGVRIFSITVPEYARCVGMSVADLAKTRGFPEQCLILGVHHDHDDSFSIPRGDNVFCAGDRVLVISRSRDIDRATELLTEAG
jgi:trk system potassium uptake protein TrkA